MYHSYILDLFYSFWALNNVQMWVCAYTCGYSAIWNLKYSSFTSAGNSWLVLSDEFSKILMFYLVKLSGFLVWVKKHRRNGYIDFRVFLCFWFVGLGFFVFWGGFFKTYFYFLYGHFVSTAWQCLEFIQRMESVLTWKSFWMAEWAFWSGEPLLLVWLCRGSLLLLGYLAVVTICFKQVYQKVPAPSMGI